jgi:hypothetical protein
VHLENWFFLPMLRFWDDDFPGQWLASVNAISICMFCVDKLGVVSYRGCFRKEHPGSASRFSWIMSYVIEQSVNCPYVVSGMKLTRIKRFGLMGSTEQPGINGTARLLTKYATSSTTRERVVILAGSMQVDLPGNNLDSLSRYVDTKSTQGMYVCTFSPVYAISL